MPTTVKITWDNGDSETVIIDKELTGSYRINLEPKDLLLAGIFKALSLAFITKCEQLADIDTAFEFTNAEVFMRTACMWAMLGVTKDIIPFGNSNHD
jgi:hypothetical protein